MIVEVDQQAVATPDDVETRVKEAKDSGYRVVTLLSFRDGDYQWVALRIDKTRQTGGRPGPPDAGRAAPANSARP